ncbi:MAG TPA: OB-fold nucleic acid binding domain-containing protein, partial [Acidimicrobiia bacterium]|nr:OB-fold nucleic acid binding domain-containing protein [Acidimicrobiia bacterium]
DWTELCKGTVPIADAEWRHRARVAGRVRSVRVQPWAGVPTLECTLVDDTAGIAVVFLGRREVAGVSPGRRMVIEGMVGDHNGRIAMLNPEYRLLATPT